MTTVTPELLAEWQKSIGRQAIEEQQLDLEPLRRYAVATGSDPDVERDAPPLAHWAFFLPLAEDGCLGPDGHPIRGDFLPAITLPRRMFASAQIDFLSPLVIGQPARQTSVILDIDLKAGSSGTLIFAVVERVLAQRGVVCIFERQTYVYRDAGEPVSLPEIHDDIANGDAWRPDPVNLFRFSAATFNSHRIHYDRAYARGVEAYPELVVQGPFTAAKLAGLVGCAGALSSFSFRAQAPLFAGQPVWLRRKADELTATRCDGAIAMTAQVRHAI